MKRREDKHLRKYWIGIFPDTSNARLLVNDLRDRKGFCGILKIDQGTHR